MGMEDVLRIDKILYFCDVPQLFVARDAFDTLYLCLLYDDETVYRYTGIRISTRRLESFLAGKADLRLLYLQPENEHEYYDVVFQSGEYQKTLLKESVLLEDKLPAEGYVLSGEKRENVVINLPIKDRSLLAELVRKIWLGLYVSLKKIKKIVPLLLESCGTIFFHPYIYFDYFFVIRNQSTSAQPPSFVLIAGRVQNIPTLAPIHCPSLAWKGTPNDSYFFPSRL